ncbi:MAG TPA: hypothetical protein VK162_26480 [Streptosporangiaceae bacterium]|nr:hypothetical protein [Streptosporangiaceae bacterium]
MAAKHHLSIFSFSSRVVDAVRVRLTAFELSKATIRFTAAMPLPDEVVRDIVRDRTEEIAGTARELRRRSAHRATCRALEDHAQHA